MSVLDAILARVSHDSVVVFDLDSTLFDTAPRHLRILHEVAAELCLPRLLDAVSRQALADMGWDVEHGLVRAGFDDRALIDRIVDAWWSRFFNGDYCRFDLPTPGAVPFVQQIWDAGAVVVYLSARPVDAMGDGTWAALRRWKLPIGVARTVLHLKADDVSDAEFKAGALRDIARLGTVIATFDNEPGHCNRFAEAFPGGVHVWLDTVHSPNAPALAPEVHGMRTFLP